MSARVFESQSFIISRNWVIINLRRIQFAIQEKQLYAERGARLKNICLSKLPCICPSLYNFRKKSQASTEISYQFLAPKIPVLRRNKATKPSSSTDPFSAAMKTLVLGNLFKHVRFAITFARAVCHWDNEKNKRIVIFSSSLSPSGKIPVRMWCQV